MKKNIYLLLSFLAIIYSCNEQKTENRNLKNTLSELNLPTYSKSELTEDFNLLVNSLKEGHTGLYWYSSEVQFDSVVTSQRKYIKDNLNGLQFYNIVAPIVAYSKEDHCDIYLSETISDFINQKGNFLPLAVLSVNEKIYVLNKPKENIKIKGFQLIKVNGKPIEKIYDTLFNTFASDGFIKQSKYRWLDNLRFSEYYARTIGQPNNFEIEVLNPETGVTKSFELQATNKQGLSKIGKDVALYSDLESADFQILPNKAALLTFNTFANENYEEMQTDFRTFVSNSFKKIDSLDIENLIIDIRENGGGTEGNEDYLFSFLADKPYNKYKNVEISAFNYSFYEHTDINTKADIEEFEKDIRKEHFLAEDGRILRKDGIEEVEPLKPNSYKGKVYVLISGWTYSGGAEFSSLMRQHTNAIFIGEETGGGFYGNTSGYGLELTLPNTKISVDIPMLKFSLDVDKGTFGRGVIPDHKVQNTFADYETGNDAILKLAKKLME